MIKFVSKRTFAEGMDEETYDSEMYKLHIGITDGKPCQLTITSKSLFYPNVISAIEEDKAVAVMMFNNITLNKIEEIDVVLQRIKDACEFVYQEALPFVNARIKELTN